MEDDELTGTRSGEQHHKEGGQERTVDNKDRSTKNQEETLGNTSQSSILIHDPQGGDGRKAGSHPIEGTDFIPGTLQAVQ